MPSVAMVHVQRQPMYSADPTDADIKDAAAREFFKRHNVRREDVVSRYYPLFNYTIFDDLLPPDLVVEWKNRLLKTAGFCVQDTKDDERHAYIELASKVCDTPERIRDVLVHEMCHAASWLIDGIRDGHGPGWRYWADRVNEVHPELPPVKPYHEYAISTKYIYRCRKCRLEVGRHTKSVDVDNQVCGLCYGKLELLRYRRDKSPEIVSPYGPRLPNPWSEFIRKNFRKVKAKNKHLAGREIMKFLSREYAKQLYGGRGARSHSVKSSYSTHKLKKNRRRCSPSSVDSVTSLRDFSKKDRARRNAPVDNDFFRESGEIFSKFSRTNAKKRIFFSDIDKPTRKKSAGKNFSGNFSSNYYEHCESVASQSEAPFVDIPGRENNMYWRNYSRDPKARKHSFKQASIYCVRSLSDPNLHRGRQDNFYSESNAHMWKFYSDSDVVMDDANEQESCLPDPYMDWGDNSSVVNLREKYYI